MGRYKAIVMERESNLLELCRYVVLNPVRAGTGGVSSWAGQRSPVLLGGVGFAERLAPRLREQGHQSTVIVD